MDSGLLHVKFFLYAQGILKLTFSTTKYFKIFNRSLLNEINKIKEVYLTFRGSKERKVKIN